MKYQIGQVAKLLDISAQGLRLYEKEGIIIPQREDSGYRSYKRLDITSLLRARSYQKYGFSLQQVKDLLNTNDLQYLYNEYENHEKVLEKKILIQQLELNRLNYTKELMKSFPESLFKISYETRPALYRFEYMCNDELIIDSDLYPVLQKWISYAPLSFSSVRNEWNQHNVYYSGISMKKDDFDKIDDSELLKNVTYYEPIECLCTIIQVNNEINHSLDYLAHVVSYIHENKLEVIGDLISESIVSYNKKEDYTRIRKIWIPIKK